MPQGGERFPPHDQVRAVWPAACADLSRTSGAVSPPVGLRPGHWSSSLWLPASRSPLWRAACMAYQDPKRWLFNQKEYDQAFQSKAYWAVPKRLVKEERWK